MRRILFLVLSVLVFSISFAQKTIHDPNAELRQTGSFHSISVSGEFDVYLSEGEEAVAVSAEETETREQIKTVVKDGVLYISAGDRKGLNFSLKNKSMKAYVSFKTLKRITASGTSDLNFEGTIRTEELKIELSGASDFEGDVSVQSLVIEQSGASDVNISGTTKDLTIHISGGSDLTGFQLAADRCSVHASGGSDVSITVNEEISAEASGASDIFWKGSGSVKKVQTSGAGSVSHRS